MRLSVILFGLVAVKILSACAAVPNQSGKPDDRPISKIEARSLSEQELKARIFAQLGSVLNEYTRPRQPGGPKRILHDLFYWTVPRAGDTRNVCRYDDVTLHFTPEGTTTRNAETPVHVSGISVDRKFFLAAPVGFRDEGNLQVDERPQYDRICAKFKPDTANSVHVDDEELLIQVAYWIRRLRAPDGGEFSSIKFECPSKANCVENIISMNPAALTEIWPCMPSISDRDDANCVQADFIQSEAASFRLTFYRHHQSDMPYQIEYDDLIVLTHERID